MVDKLNGVGQIKAAEVRAAVNEDQGTAGGGTVPIGQTGAVSTGNMGSNLSTRFDYDGQVAALERKKQSADVIQMQIDAERVRQNIMKYVVPKIDIEAVGEMFTDKSEPKIQKGYIDNLVGSVAGERVDESALPPSFKAIENTRLSEEQKQALIEDLNHVASMDLQSLCHDYGINLDVSGLKNLTEEATAADIKAQRELVDKLFADITGGTDKKGETTGLVRVMAERAKADKTVASNNEQLARLRSAKQARIDNGEIKEGEADPNDALITKLQEANMKALSDVAKADSVYRAIQPVYNELMSLQSRLENLDKNLKNIEDFDRQAAQRAAEFAVKEDKALEIANKEKSKAVEARDTAEEKMRKEIEKDKKQDRYEDKTDTKIKAKTAKKDVVLQEKQTVATEKIKAAKKAQDVVDKRTEKQEELLKLKTPPKKEVPVTDEAEKTPENTEPPVSKTVETPATNPQGADTFELKQFTSYQDAAQEAQTIIDKYAKDDIKGALTVRAKLDPTGKFAPVIVDAEGNIYDNTRDIKKLLGID